MIRIFRGELAEAGTPGLLRPITAEWTAVTPAMRRLEVAAGTDLERQCRSLGELPVGSAVVTGAGDLPAEFMVHVVVRSIEQRVTPAGVRKAFSAGLRRLDEWGIRKVAMPLLGTGAGNLDAEEAAALLIAGLAEAEAQGRAPEETVLVADSEYEESAIETAMRAAGQPAQNPAAGD